jgi:hypothetical protein
VDCICRDVCEETEEVGLLLVDLVELFGDFFGYLGEDDLREGLLRS